LTSGRVCVKWWADQKEIIMFGRIIRGKSVEDCVEHHNLQDQIDGLRKEVGILNCKEHKYVMNRDRQHYSPLYFGVKCEKCGEIKSMTQLEFAEHRMLFADADHKKLSDEIKRLKDYEKALKMVSASLNGKTKEK
jgi:hypothetical protein